MSGGPVVTYCRHCEKDLSELSDWQLLTELCGCRLDGGFGHERARWSAPPSVAGDTSGATGVGPVGLVDREEE